MCHQTKSRQPCSESFRRQKKPWALNTRKQILVQRRKMFLMVMAAQNGVNWMAISQGGRIADSAVGWGVGGIELDDLHRPFQSLPSVMLQSCNSMKIPQRNFGGNSL